MHSVATLSDARIRELVNDAAAATGFDPIDMIGTHLLGWLKAAERAGATIYWGCLPDAKVLRDTIIGTQHVVGGVA